MTLNKSVISGKCSGCAAYKERVERALAELKLAKDWVSVEDWDPAARRQATKFLRAAIAALEGK